MPVSKNCIPLQFYAHDSRKVHSFDIRRLCASLKGDTIIGCSVAENTFDHADYDFTGSWGIWLEENLPAYIQEFHLLLKSGRKISFSSHFDWGIVTLLDKRDDVIKIPSLQINQYLKAPMGTPFT